MVRILYKWAVWDNKEKKWFSTRKGKNIWNRAFGAKNAVLKYINGHRSALDRLDKFDHQNRYKVVKLACTPVDNSKL